MVGNVSTVIRLLLFIGLPALELVLLIQLGEWIGLAGTFLLIVATGMVGASMVKRQGREVWQAIQLRMAEGRVPDVELAHGAMLLVAGALLLTPGVITDVVGLLLLVPWIRELIRVRFFRAMRVVVW